jgi:hypothetical protein
MINRFLYQNRLRAVEFVRLAQEAGFTIEVDTSRARPDRLRALESMPVAPRFRGYTREQLAITSIDFVGRNPARPAVNKPPRAQNAITAGARTF